jgi:hypothetical protein
MFQHTVFSKLVFQPVRWAVATGVNRRRIAPWFASILMFPLHWIEN